MKLMKNKRQNYGESDEYDDFSGQSANLMAKLSQIKKPNEIEYIDDNDDNRNKLKMKLSESQILKDGKNSNTK